MKHLPSTALTVLLALLVSGCNKPSATKTDFVQAQNDSVELPVDHRSGWGRDSLNYERADYRILFIGNSHTSTCRMPKMVERMLNARSKKRVYCEICANSFLVDHAQSKVTTDRIKNKKWDIVVLQAQKYSTSGKYEYPITGALQLTELAKNHGALVIMYPEWGRRQDKSEAELKRCMNEAKRIHKLHETIVDKSGASIAPIGRAWNAALTEHPEWDLHSDGNHANELGAYLTASVFDKLISRLFLQLPVEQWEKPSVHVLDASRISRELQTEAARLAAKALDAYLVPE